MAISEGTLAIGNKVIVPSGSTNNSLSELNDVNISNASDGQVLVYDEATNKWVNANEREINAEDVEYDSNTSVKSAIDGISVLKINANTYNTIGLALAQINNAFNTLTDAQKERSYIVIDNLQIFNKAYETGVYTFVGVNLSSVNMRSIHLNDNGNQYYIWASLTSSGNTIVNHTTDSQSVSIELKC
jgi:hypothetical protein